MSVVPVRTLLLQTLVGLGSLLLLANSANAQIPNHNLKPTYGEISLQSGFPKDPFVNSVRAGGSLVVNLGGVKSHVANAPDFRLNYKAGANPLAIYVISKSDTTLLINMPSGAWAVDDDSGKGTNPLISRQSPKSGRYDIYVGTFGKEVVDATLVITELKPNFNLSVKKEPNYKLKPIYGSLSLNADFDDDPREVRVKAGGPIFTKLGGVKANVTQAPTYRVKYKANDSFDLTFYVTSQEDTTLLINAPNGKWYANDDFGGELDPQITFKTPRSGTYDIYVGSFGKDTGKATLKITELK